MSKRIRSGRLRGRDFDFQHVKSIYLATQLSPSWLAAQYALPIDHPGGENHSNAVLQTVQDTFSFARI